MRLEEAVVPNWFGCEASLLILLNPLHDLEHLGSIHGFSRWEPVRMHIILLWSADIGDCLWSVSRIAG
eukprot:12904557-Prorocentrum_lima.AAC.1